MKSNTKERILDAALELFSVQGYEKVSMKDIASAVDIKAPSLYKHYASKQEIYDSIVRRNEEIIYEFTSSLGIAQDSQTTTQDMFFLTPEDMSAIGVQLFDFLLHDSNTVRFRRMLAMRQYSNTNLAQIYTRFYIEQPMRFQGEVAAALQNAAGNKDADAELLGLEFYAPIFLLIMRCDLDPSYESKARKLLVKHMKHFFLQTTP